MLITVSADGDGINSALNNAKLANDIEECRKISVKIDAGNKLFQQFAENNLGQLIEMNGDEVIIQIPADKLPEIPEIASKYTDLTGYTITIGTGMDLMTSAKALLIGKLRGKNNITIWDDSMQEEIDAMADRERSISEEQKQLNEFNGNEETDILNKADPSDIQRILQPTVPRGKPHVSLPPVDMPEEEQKPNYEEEFHNAAQKQGAQDLFNKEHSQDVFKKLKSNLYSALEDIRKQLPNLLQLKQTNPEAYNSILNLIQGVIQLGQESQEKTLAKSEDLENLMKAISTLSPGKRLEAKLSPHPRAEGVKVFSRTFDYSHLLPNDVKNSGFKLHVEHNNTMLPKGVKSVATSMTSPNIMPVRPTEIIRARLMAPTGADIGSVTGHVSNKSKGRSIEPHSDLDAPYRGKGLGTAMYEAAYAHAKNTGVNRVEGGVHSPDAHALHTRLSKKHGFHYKSNREPGVNDDFFPYKPYSYALKAEMPLQENEDGFIGPGHGPIFYRDGVVQKDEENPGEGANEGTPRRTGANAGGAQAGRAHLNLPVGSLVDGKTKMINGQTGLANWRSVKGGAIASQQHNPPILGANSSATSAKNPDR